MKYIVIFGIIIAVIGSITVYMKFDWDKNYKHDFPVTGTKLFDDINIEFGIYNRSALFKVEEIESYKEKVISMGLLPNRSIGAVYDYGYAIAVDKTLMNNSFGVYGLEIKSQKKLDDIKRENYLNIKHYGPKIGDRYIFIIEDSYHSLRRLIKY